MTIFRLRLWVGKVLSVTNPTTCVSHITTWEGENPLEINHVEGIAMISGVEAKQSALIQDMRRAVCMCPTPDTPPSDAESFWASLRAHISWLLLDEMHGAPWRFPAL